MLLRCCKGPSARGASIFEGCLVGKRPILYDLVACLPWKDKELGERSTTASLRGRKEWKFGLLQATYILK